MKTKPLDVERSRIVVTDSGLGGISVLADLENRLKQYNTYKNVDLIFFNALYSKSLGYNTMDSIDEKVKVFNNALISMRNNYNPDIILIACNTLSVIYHLTQFSKNTDIRVEGIVKNGVELFFENLLDNKESAIIIFGTPTTIESQQHKILLSNKGIEENRILNISCPMLESEIQDDPNSKKTIDLIKKYVHEASMKLPKRYSKVYGGLCCTHYGYSSGVFYKEMKKKFGSKIDILNPNEQMVESILYEKNNSDSSTEINLKIISQVEIYDHEMKVISNAISAFAPQTVEAIKNYEHNPKLFDRKYRE